MGETLSQCKEKRLWWKFEKRLKGTDFWLESESWISTVTDDG